MKNPFESFGRSNSQGTGGASESAQTRGDRARAEYEERAQQQNQDANRLNLLNQMFQAGLSEAPTRAADQVFGAVTEAVNILRTRGVDDYEAVQQTAGLLQHEYARIANYNDSVAGTRDAQAQIAAQKIGLKTQLSKQPYSIARGAQKPLPERPELPEGTSLVKRIFSGITHSARISTIKAGRGIGTVIKQATVDGLAGGGVDSVLNDAQVLINQRGEPVLRVTSPLSTKETTDIPLTAVNKDYLVIANSWGNRPFFDKLTGLGNLFSTKPKEKRSPFGEVVIFNPRGNQVIARIPAAHPEEKAADISTMAAVFNQEMPLSPDYKPRPNNADLFGPVALEIARQLGIDLSRQTNSEE